MRFNRSAYIFSDLFTCGSFTKKLDVFFPRERHQNAHPCGSAMIEEPPRRRMINPHNVQARLTHQCQIGIHPFRPADIVSVRIWFKRTVRDPFDEKLLLAFEKELRLGQNPVGCRLCHVESCSVIPSAVEAATQRTESARPGFPFHYSADSRLLSSFPQPRSR